MAERCWIVRRPGESDMAAEERHYTEEQARREMSTLVDDGESATVEQVSAPCIELTCQGCGYQFDEDDEGIIHFESIEQAHAYVIGLGYEGVVFAGDLLMRCNADCPGNTLDGEPAESEVSDG